MAAQEWIVGADASCDIVVDEQTVSSRHCRLQRTSRGWLVEDLGSTNGTYVRRRRIYEPTEFQDGDKVTLGTAVDLPLPAVEPLVAAPDWLGQVAVRLRSPGALAAVMGGVLLLPLFGWWLASERGPQTVAEGTGTSGERKDGDHGGGETEPGLDTPPRPASSPKAPDPLPQAAPRVDEDGEWTPATAALGPGPTGRLSPAGPPDVPRDSSPAPVPAHSSTPSESQDSAYFMVVVEGGGGIVHSLVGTAVLVAPGKLLTAAQVLVLCEQLEPDNSGLKFGKPKVLQPATGREFTIVGVHIHPEFEAGRRQYAEIHRKVMDQEEQAQGNPGAPSSAESHGELDQLRKALWQAVARTSGVDVAILDIEGLPASPPVPIARDDAPSREGAVKGFSRSKDQSLMQFKDARATVQQFPWRMGASPTPGRGITLETDSAAAGQHWLGSPVLNGKGEIVGVYCGDSNSAEILSAIPGGQAFVAAPVNAVRAVALPVPL